MKRWWLHIIAGFLVMTLAGCASSATEEPTATIAPSATHTATPEPSPTSTSTPTPTYTPSPTKTPRPTRTPTPEPTATNTPVPVIPTDVPTLSPEDATHTADAQPTSETQPSNTPDSAPPTNTPEAEDWAPKTDTVWVLSRDPFNRYKTEACTEDLNVDLYGMVAVSPADNNGLSWRRQDNITYYLARGSINNYWGSGRSSIPNFTLNIAVTFNSTTTLVVTYSLIPDSNPTCSYVLQYTGEFAW